MISLVWILIFGSLVESTGSQSYKNVTDLRTTLLTSYNPDVLPLNDFSDVLNINITTSIIKMPEVNPVHGALSMAIMVKLRWYDERLTWNPASHNGIKNISIKSKEVWTPPLAVANPVKFTLLGQPWMQVMFTSDGKASYEVGGIIEFSCAFYMKFWPFDEHMCSLGLFPYGYPGTKVILTASGNVVNTDMYEKNGEWHLDKTSFKYETDMSGGESRAVYSFRIARQSAFYMVTVIVPMNGIGALISLVFLLPSECGERVGYSITIMLSLAVFLSVIAADLPKNSEPIPVMCVYILFKMLMCILGVILVILNLALYHRNENIPISNFYRSLVRLSRCTCCRRKVLTGKIHTHVDPVNSENEINSISKSNGQINVREKFSQDMELDNSDEALGTEENLRWEDVSKAIDKLLFYAMFPLTQIPSLVLLIYISVVTGHTIQ
ncbi:neuronal acetylcholine receptor subunit alpha-6-like [Mercenaria mercenaria]|uniref:neuronal acetylcholine receptor subunit alpha-6-like n=1 Tax=Mercenaria mercenaria TaxID=6596 RepID=UPI00234E39D4|nr:neuronal acetylcholine receptor subunit alpha-6-like [Mercenaria mercenaria]